MTTINPPDALSATLAPDPSPEGSESDDDWSERAHEALTGRVATAVRTCINCRHLTLDQQVARVLDVVAEIEQRKALGRRKLPAVAWEPIRKETA